MKRHVFKDYQHNIIGYLETSDNSDDGVVEFVLVLIGIVGLLLYGVVLWAWEQVNNWFSFELPYKFIAFYYFCIIAMPIKIGHTIYECLLNSNITRWPNLNFVVSVASTSIYIVLVVMFLYWLFRRLSAKFLLALLICPALFALIWFIFALIWNWLFEVT